MKDINDLYEWYENLTKADLERINEFYDEACFFKDPFNEFLGRGKIKNIFVEMFAKLENPRFIFIDKLKQDNQVFITWDFVFTINKKNYQIHGSSHLKLNEEMKIVYHRDYWDVGEELLLKIPVVKNIYGALRKKFASH